MGGGKDVGTAEEQSVGCGRMLQSWRFGSAGEREVPGVASALSRVSPEVGWRIAGQAGGARQRWAKAFIGRERLELFAQRRRKGRWGES